MSAHLARRSCGREFTPAELEHIRQLLELRPILGMGRTRSPSRKKNQGVEV
jgi:hypothetical protein